MSRFMLGLVLSACLIALVVAGCGAAASSPEQPAGQDVADDPECRSHADCDDGLFCNGQERCLRGVCEAGDRPCGDQACDEGQAACAPDTPIIVPVPVVGATNMDILRAACPLISDASIIDGVSVIDADWSAGFTYQEELDFNSTSCLTTSAYDGCVRCFDAIVDFVYFVAHEGQDPPAPPVVPGPPVAPPPLPTPPVVVPPIPTGSILVAYDGQFLGNVNDNQYESDSIANRYGTYGSRYNALSIWNRYGTYGSSNNVLSPWSTYSSTPPCIYENGVCVLYVTAGFLQPSIHPNDLAIAVGRTDVSR
mgnify:CR=1 FL=1